MWFPFSISNFDRYRSRIPRFLREPFRASGPELGLWAALFILPLVAFDVLYVRATSPSIREFRNEELELSLEARTANVLVVGNSIPRRWHQWLLGNTNPHRNNGEDDRVLNLGLGGATGNDWEYLLEKGLRNAPAVKRVFVVANDFRFTPDLRDTIYLPLAISFSELARWYWNDRATPGELSYLLQAKVLASVGFRNEVMFRFYRAFVPGFSDVEDTLASARPPGVGLGIMRRVESLRSTVARSAAAGASVEFVLAPLGPIAPDDRESARRSFLKVCSLGPFACRDLSDTFPMTAFEPDGVHLKHTEGLELFRRVVGGGAGGVK